MFRYKKKGKTRYHKVRSMKYRFKTKPYGYQVAALKKLLMNRGGALFMDMGTGKTKIAIDFAACMRLKEHVERVLIICPKSVVAVWRNETLTRLSVALIVLALVWVGIVIASHLSLRGRRVTAAQRTASVK